VKSNVKSRSAWLRIFFVLVVIALYWVCGVVIGAVVAFQCVWLLFTGESNEKLRGLGRSLATYVRQAVGYLTFDTEDRPFPLDLDWPAEPPAG
ncbi:MAG: DUF4389 domain-containing protein, partial [Woeseiaceae bacterium]|nr:DUF4389 domain-containing protein [Woeseiaceae bacterium]